MKKLVVLLIDAEVNSVITGKYSSFYSSKEINNKMLILTTLETENNNLGRYTLLVKEITNRNIHCILCDKNGQPLSSYKDCNEDIAIFLNPHQGDDDNTGEFILRKRNIQIPPQINL